MTNWTYYDMDADVILQRGETCHDKSGGIRREPCIMSLSVEIERKEIVKDDHDRQNFVYRMGTIALETGTLIYAWTLMTNSFKSVKSKYNGESCKAGPL